MSLFYHYHRLIFIAMSLTAVGHLWSYDYTVCEGEVLKWPSENITTRPSSVSFPSGSAPRDALERAISDLNAAPSPFDINTQYETGISNDNGENEIWGSDSLSPPAVARTWYTCRNPLIGSPTVKINEVDVVVDTRVNWMFSQNKSSSNAYTGSARPLTNTLEHELGHLVGLNHETRYYNNMGEDWDHIHANGDQIQSYVGEDMADGMNFLYDDIIIGADVGVVHWRHTGSSGGYSTHGRTRIFDTSGNELNDVSSNGQEPRYLVDNGQTIEAEFSIETNFSGRHEGLEIGFFLSENDLITTHDEKIGETTLGAITRNDVYTRRFEIELPSDLMPETDYHVGIIVDVNDEIDEIRESNNATYIGIRTKDFDVVEFIPPPHRIFPGSIKLQDHDNLRQSEWFGFFDTKKAPWLYHYEHGYIYVKSSRQSTFDYYDSDLGWVHTNKSFYPFIYNYERKAWMYYYEGLSDPRYFFDYSTREWITI